MEEEDIFLAFSLSVKRVKRARVVYSPKSKSLCTETGLQIPMWN